MSNRGWYAGGITLMLAAAGLALRPTVIRAGVAVLALLTTLFVLGQPPVADLMVLLPGFETAHNGRMVIFVLFALALLAGWGLDELSGGELPRGLPRGVVLAAAAAIFCVPFAWLLVAGTIDLGALRPALEVAWLFHEPPGGHGARRKGRGRADRAAELTAAVAAAGGRGPGADRAASGGRARALAPGAGAVRGRGGGAAGRRPVPGQHGLQSGDSDRARAPADHRVDPPAAVAAPQPLRGGGGARRRSSRWGPTSPFATGSTTRAATTIPSSAATTACGGPPRAPAAT